MTFTAKYSGRCAADCGHPITPGDTVEYVDGELVHDGCTPAAAAEVEREAHPVCPLCWTEEAVNGACAC